VAINVSWLLNVFNSKSVDKPIVAVDKLEALSVEKFATPDVCISLQVMKEVFKVLVLVVCDVIVEKLASVGKGSVTEIVFPFNVIPVPAIKLCWYPVMDDALMVDTFNLEVFHVPELLIL